MKKIFGILIVSFALFVSCTNDLLEPFTPGSLTEEVAVTKSSDLVRLVNSSMNILTNRADYVFSSIFTDEAAPGSNNGGQGITTDYVFLMNVSNGSAAAIWQSNYFALARINRVITFADQVVAISPADQQVINRAKAEALVLRALAHLKIMSYFSTNPKDDAALAGVLADRNSDVILDSFGDHSIIFSIRVWTQDFSKQPGLMRHQINMAVWESLKLDGIEIPFPQMDLHLYSKKTIEPPVS